MSLAHSPKIITDSLVFYYDMNNDQKSWKGAPTTNLSNNNVFYSNWANSGTGVWNADDTVIGRLYNDYPVLSLRVTATGNLHVSCGRASISAGLTYTVSLYVYISTNAGTLAGSVPYIRTDPANTSRGTLNYNGDSNWNNWPRDKWIRITQTFTNTANDTALYISCYLNTLDNKIYMTVPTVENIGVMTAFVGGAGSSRSNTQALLDIKKSTTLTVNSLTYNSDGSFSFNGTSNYIYSNTPVNLPIGSQNSTVIVWCKPDSTGPSNQYTGLVSYGARFSATPSNARLLSLYTSGTTMYVSSAFWGNDYIPNTLAVTANAWNMVGMISRGAATTNNVTLLCGNSNGLTLQTGSSTSYTRGLNTTGSNLAIGCTDYPGRYFKGQIDKVFIYNRELTTNEIQTLFNAHKSRYGL